MLRVPMNTSQAKRIQLKWWKDEKMEMKSGIRCHLKIPLHLKENFAKSEESRRSKDERFIFDQHFEYLLMTSLISKECYLSDNILLAAANYIAIYRLKIRRKFGVKIGSMNATSVIGSCHGENKQVTKPKKRDLMMTGSLRSIWFLTTFFPFKCLSRK